MEVGCYCMPPMVDTIGLTHTKLDQENTLWRELQHVHGFHSWK